MNAEPKHGALFALKVEVELEAKCHSPTDRRARGILRIYVFCTLEPRRCMQLKDRKRPPQSEIAW